MYAFFLFQNFSLHPLTAELMQECVCLTPEGNNVNEIISQYNLNFAPKWQKYYSGRYYRLQEAYMWNPSDLIASIVWDSYPLQWHRYFGRAPAELRALGAQGQPKRFFSFSFLTSLKGLTEATIHRSHGFFIRISRYLFYRLPGY